MYMYMGTHPSFSTFAFLQWKQFLRFPVCFLGQLSLSKSGLLLNEFFFPEGKILSFKSRLPLRRESKMKMALLFPFEVYPFNLKLLQRHGSKTKLKTSI